MKRKILIRKKRPGDITIFNIIIDETNEIWARVAVDKITFKRLILIGKHCYNLSMNTKQDLCIAMGILLTEGIKNQINNDKELEGDS